MANFFKAARMDKASFRIINSNTQDSFSKEIFMGKVEFNINLYKATLKEFSKKTKKSKDFCNTPTAISIKVHSRINKNQDLESTAMLQVTFILVISRKGKEVDLEKWYLVMEICMKVCGRVI